MILTTLAYIEKEEKYLMLYRNKKENDINEGKFVGIGGKLEHDESPREAIIREIKEETNLDASNPEYQGMVTFVNDICETELIFIYLVREFSGEIQECNEGELHWIEKDRILELNLWAGDRYFLEPIINGKLTRPIDYKFIYSKDELIEVIM
ncbi:MAG: 8-oxo-dGTP diphosphatase [Erysipelotrichaceae bacterium]|nr:8-oxo-dGTP diphosphatase [Erysipelotrichaceae bacterium]MDD3810404.1 8-oxo-dGTP diphosphatase [Erysipelotrichaceae bacterium]